MAYRLPRNRECETCHQVFQTRYSGRHWHCPGCQPAVHQSHQRRRDRKHSRVCKAARAKPYSKAHPRSVMALLEETFDDEYFEPAPASEPTNSRPWSRERIEVLAQRVLAGEDLWCQGDWRADED